jgi:hypothetical protein
MSPDCRHLLCELIGGPCSLATNRTRGCRPGLAPKTAAPEVFDEVRALVAQIDPEDRDERGRAAAARLARIIRREALDDRNLVALARDEEPELGAALAALCVRRR